MHRACRARTKTRRPRRARPRTKARRPRVVLDAGLDTYAFRSPYADRLTMFEVGHPSTQTWKGEKLANASIAIPPTLTFVPVELERERLDDALRAAGFDLAVPTFFSWLGVTPYLTESAVLDTIGLMARHPGGAHVVFDYANPTASIRDENLRTAQEALTAHVSQQGEPFRSYFDTEALHRALRTLGFRSIEDLGFGAIARRYFGSSTGSAPDRGGHVGHATTLA